jgi:hypothetical protein
LYRWRPAGRHWHLSRRFRDGNIREALATWWLRLLFGEAGAKQAKPVASVRNDTLQFLVLEG